MVLYKYYFSYLIDDVSCMPCDKTSEKYEIYLS